MILPVVAGFDAAGLGAGRAAWRRELLRRCLGRLPARSGSEPIAVFVPGRIEVLGKHTDYAGGRSLLCAADLGFVLAAHPRSDDEVRVESETSAERCACRLDGASAPLPGHWSNYPATVVRRVARDFPGARTGADIVFASDLPPAAGLSSSSAFMIGVFAVIAAINRIDQAPAYRSAVGDRLALAAYLATIENGQSFGALAGDQGVGTFGGSEDHTAILCCRPHFVAQYAFAPARFEAEVPLDGEWVLAVASSGVLAEKTGAARERYNAASRLAAAVLETWNAVTGRQDETLEAAATSAPDGRERLDAVLARHPVPGFTREAARARARQFCLESLDIVPGATAALARRDYGVLGALVDQSQAAAEQWLGNQVPETIFLARCARECGAAAASAFGAGFGGSVWALVQERDAAAFTDAWHTRYRHAFPDAAARATFLLTPAGPAAFALAEPSREA